MTTVYVGVGSNLGNRESNIFQARDKLISRGIEVTRTSPFYENEAITRPGEPMPPFINAVFEVRTSLRPNQLLMELETIEREMGRTSKGDWRPRVIDLDILFYGREVYESKQLKIPHPEVERRLFVLKPMADLAPNWVHPVVKKTMGVLCNSSSTQPT